MSNLNLKICILRSGRKGYEIAQQLGWHPTKLSQIISGVYLPDEEDKRLLANAIGTSVTNIFQNIKDQENL
ncbi:helix-turn-helix transcriptional regulator [Nitrospinae bacterium]|nr:helix-turn-helix transcriptional regulator [Nitrospinota bacterium]